jgi:transposase
MATPQITHETMADIPLLMHILHEMLEYDKLLDQIDPPHGNWQGLSLGKTMVTWMTHILSEGNHYMSHVQDWVAQSPHLWAGLWGQTVRPLDVSDDRLAEVARRLSLAEVWEPLEQKITQRMVRVYELPTEQVRLDTTTAKVYGGSDLSVLFQRGHSKDHRPDLRQLKVMLAALDPLGVLVGADVVSGNTADDGLYVPMIARLRSTLPAKGLLYIGDCKMGALATRAYVARTGNSYLMPLAQVGGLPEQLDKWIDEAVRGKQHLQPLLDVDGKTRLGEAYERHRQVTAETNTETLKWDERVLIVHSTAYAKAAVKSLHKRLAQAQTELHALTPPRGRGQRQFTDEAELQAAVDAILTRYDVTELLLTVELQRETECRAVRAYRQTPARSAERHRYVVKVKENRVQLRKLEPRLGWRVYVTNASARKLPLKQAILAYRDEWLVERNCARLKGRALSLAPLWVRRDDHALGLTRLLTLAARVLALAEYQVRRTLAKDERALVGLYPGQPTRATAQPTTERLLQAFKTVSLTLVQKDTQIFYLLMPLSDLQRTILHDLGCPANLYQSWFPKSWKPLRI